MRTSLSTFLIADTSVIPTPTRRQSRRSPSGRELRQLGRSSLHARYPPVLLVGRVSGLSLLSEESRAGSECSTSGNCQSLRDGVEPEGPSDDIADHGASNDDDGELSHSSLLQQLYSRSSVAIGIDTVDRA